MLFVAHFIANFERHYEGKGDSMICRFSALPHIKGRTAGRHFIHLLHSQTCNISTTIEQYFHNSTLAKLSFDLFHFSETELTKFSAMTTNEDNVGRWSDSREVWNEVRCEQTMEAVGVVWNDAAGTAPTVATIAYVGLEIIYVGAFLDEDIAAAQRLLSRKRWPSSRARVHAMMAAMENGNRTKRRP